MKSVDMSIINAGNFSQTDNMAETTEDYDDIDHVGCSSRSASDGNDDNRSIISLYR